MKMFKILSVGAVGLLMTGCFKMEETNVIKEDGQFSYNLSVDYSQVKSIEEAGLKIAAQERELLIELLKNSDTLEEEIEINQEILAELKIEKEDLDKSAQEINLDQTLTEEEKDFNKEFLKDLKESLTQNIADFEEIIRKERLLLYNKDLSEARKIQMYNEIADLELGEEEVSQISCENMKDEFTDIVRGEDFIEIQDMDCRELAGGNVIEIDMNGKYIGDKFSYKNGIYTIKDYLNQEFISSESTETEMSDDFFSEDLVENIMEANIDIMKSLISGTGVGYEGKMTFALPIRETNFGKIDGNSIVYKLEDMIKAMEEGKTDLIVETIAAPVQSNNKIRNLTPKKVNQASIKSASPYASRNWRRNHAHASKEAPNYSVNKVVPVSAKSGQELSPVRRYHQIQMQRLRNR